MESRKYSGYLADDESFRRPQDRNAHASSRRSPCDWRSLLRPPSRCQFRNQRSPTSTGTFNNFSRGDQGKRKHYQSSSSSSNGRPSHLANEFSEFVDFLADEEVLDSLQLIVEDAVRKLRDMTTQSGDPVFDIQEDSRSSVDSESWTYSYSSMHSQIKYQTTTTSSSDDDQEKRFTSGGESKSGGKICLLDKYVARLPKDGKKAVRELSGGLHAETFSEQSGDSYFFWQEHLHVWAKLAKSMEQPRRDYFAKLKKALPQESFSLESLHKEITSVLKRPTPRCIPLYYATQEPFHALDFLEENKILVALQDIINQAVLKVLEATMTGGIPFIDLFDERSYLWESSEEEEGSGSESGSGEETSEEGDAPEEPPPKPKYVPPPLPKPKQKKLDASQTETETTKSTILTRDIITPKDIKRARLQARPLPKQSIIDFLIENAAKMILYKYNYETLLSEKLGFISVPVTKVLLEIMFGYKKVRGSGIRLSSQIDWTKVYEEVYKKRPPKPKVPKPDKKKGGDKKKKKPGEKTKTDEKKTTLLKPTGVPKGKVVVMKLPGEQDTKSHKTEGLTSITEQGEPDIFEIVPPQFPTDTEPDQVSADEYGFTQPSSSRPSAIGSPDSVKASTVTVENPRKFEDAPGSPSAAGTPRHSHSSRKANIAPQSNRGSTGLLPEVESTSQLPEAQLKKSFSHKSSFGGEGSKTVLPKI
ncbi:coiled-coil domain-containing protein 116 [Python bivittatus]|uniref:Coiled-coil domain-containing protein 116 n=1 Tax=Python bivittatus TaxID=176946 RepID=A0A9F5JAF3_PYTBI|nr:coiled-coil domain-containing protein 116 [Python bivittatus]